MQKTNKKNKQTPKQTKGFGYCHTNMYAFAETTKLSLQPHVSCIAHNGVISRKSSHLISSAAALGHPAHAPKSAKLLFWESPLSTDIYKTQKGGLNTTTHDSYG